MLMKVKIPIVDFEPKYRARNDLYPGLLLKRREDVETFIDWKYIAEPQWEKVVVQEVDEHRVHVLSSSGTPADWQIGGLFAYYEIV